MRVASKRLHATALQTVVDYVARCGHRPHPRRCGRGCGRWPQPRPQRQFPETHARGITSKRGGRFIPMRQTPTGQQLTYELGVSRPHQGHHVISTLIITAPCDARQSYDDQIRVPHAAANIRGAVWLGQDALDIDDCRVHIMHMIGYR